MSHFEIFSAVLSVVGSVIVGYFAYLAASASRQVNDAVNHRHEKRGEGALKLYDLVWENHEKSDELIQWKRGYEGGPMDNGRKVVQIVEETNQRLKELETQCYDCPNKKTGENK